ncbi:MAG: BlaI/MecI/CopY family transcriptional regulator [Candidatus Latescibacterota bacterium]
MPERHLPRPTDAELTILNVLWDRGPSTVRQVYEEVTAQRRIGYTTVLKFLQIMHGKGLVIRDESERTHVYYPRAGRQQTQRQLVGDLVERAFGGSALTLVQQALSSRRASQEELAEIRRLLDQMEGGKR